MKNILITGGAGFIGSNLSLELVSKGYNVTVLDNLSLQIHGNQPEENSSLYLSIKNSVNFIKGCITDRELLKQIIPDKDAIIHLAAETGTGQSMYQIKKYTDINIGGTAVILDVLANSVHKVKKMIIASSRSIYGEGKYLSEKYGIVYPNHRNANDMDKGNFAVSYLDDSNLEIMPTDEVSKIHPSSVYGITKQNQEQMVMTVCPTIGISPVAFRYQNVYGPGQSLSNPYTGILSIFSTLILNDKDINIFEDGLESRDFVFIKDVVTATINGLESTHADGEVFNVGSGLPITVLEVAKELVDNYGSQIRLNISGNYRLGDIRHNYADLRKIKSILGFEPKFSFKDGIKPFCDWVKNQEVKESKYEESLIEMRGKGLFK